jgi:hypothetical protein
MIAGHLLGLRLSLSLGLRGTAVGSGSPTVVIADFGATSAGGDAALSSAVSEYSEPLLARSSGAD